MRSSRFPRSKALWTIPVWIAGATLGGYCLSIARTPSDKVTAWLCIGLSSMMGLTMMAWEVGQNFQGEGAGWKSGRIGGQTRTVWLWPASKLNILLVVFIMVGVGVGSVLYFFYGPVGAGLHHWEMGFAALFAPVAAVGLGFTTFTKIKGIALVPEGI